MDIVFDEVQEEDFSRIGGDKPSYLKIEEKLIEVGGGGVTGNSFKVEALKAAGWSYGKMTSYASRAPSAASAFNRLREALDRSSERAEILDLLATA